MTNRHAKDIRHLMFLYDLYSSFPEAPLRLHFYHILLHQLFTT